MEEKEEMQRNRGKRRKSGQIYSIYFSRPRSKENL